MARVRNRVPAAKSLAVSEPSFTFGLVTELVAKSAAVMVPSLICAPVMSAAAPAETVEHTTAVTMTAPTVTDVCENLMCCPDPSWGNGCPMLEARPRSESGSNLNGHLGDTAAPVRPRVE